MHHCSSSSSVAGCVASSGGGAVAAAAAAAGSSYTTTMMMGGAVATHAHRFSLRQQQSRPLSAFDCLGLALVWGVFGIGLVLLLLESVVSPRMDEPMPPPPALSQVEQP